MPYIALQLVGIAAVLDTIGLGGSSNTFVKDLPLFIAFAVLAAFTYSSGLRAPALIAFVKDTLIYLVIVVAVVWVAVDLGYGIGVRCGQDQDGDPDRHGCSHGSVHPRPHLLLGVCVAGVRLRPCPVHVSALDDRRALRAGAGT